ncbi:phospholipase A2 precursor, putative [Ixodes scapularis]|uniref:Phospholipase A2 n=1 Tax=Ixodes scapularis TaxID=6945 RepID=B7Q3X6_IXOSC|nr:phospholipase A2 precursor, putative [Ixodes scapularis]|eukprot:XP_002399706.1 phospholipase A2 precursor, putative [Ixodes scapularis]
MFSKYLYLWVTLIMNTNMMNLLNHEAHGLEQKLIRKARSFNFIEEFARTSVPGVSHRIITDVQDGGHRLVEISQDSSGKVLNCNAFGSKELIDTMLNEVPDNAITTVTEDEMDQFVDLCHNREINATEEAPKSIFNIVGHILQRFVIYPGTKWCGDGTLAKNYDDLGMDREADMCCRDHDHSSDSIGALQTKHGLTNSKPYTMTHCKDDCNLYNCLRNVNSSVSNAVGVIYFDVLKLKCFAYNYPQHCTKQNRFYIPLLTERCKEYGPDTSKPKQWGVFTQPNYHGTDETRTCPAGD